MQTTSHATYTLLGPPTAAENFSKSTGHVSAFGAFANNPKIQYLGPNKVLLTYYEAEVPELALEDHFKRSLNQQTNRNGDFKVPIQVAPRRRKVPASFYNRHIITIQPKMAKRSTQPNHQPAVNANQLSGQHAPLPARINMQRLADQSSGAASTIYGPPPLARAPPGPGSSSGWMYPASGSSAWMTSQMNQRHSVANPPGYNSLLLSTPQPPGRQYGNMIGQNAGRPADWSTATALPGYSHQQQSPIPESILPPPTYNSFVSAGLETMCGAGSHGHESFFPGSSWTSFM